MDTLRMSGLRRRRPGLDKGVISCIILDKFGSKSVRENIT
jgi:hypothetical protein